MKRTDIVLNDVVHMYYLSGLTQKEIAQRLGISRSYVSRLLSKAITEGMVRICIEIEDPQDLIDLDLSNKLKVEFGVDILVVKTVNGKQSKSSVGRVGARVLRETILKKAAKPGSDGDEFFLGVSWGSTIFEVVEHIKYYPNFPRNITVVPLVGGLGTTATKYHANEIAREIANIFRGTWLPVYAPAFVKDDGVKQQIMKDPGMLNVLKAWERVEVALVGIGSVSTASILVQSGYLSEKLIELLKKAGAVCDILGIFFDSSGKKISLPEVENRSISIPLQRLRNVSEIIAVAAGKEKATAIASALKTGLIKTLIIDDETALLLNP